MGQVGDFISMMLVRWSWPALLRASRCMVRLMQRCEHGQNFLLDPEEALWSKQTVVEWAPGCECTLEECFSGSLERGEKEGASEEISTLLRACFLLTLLYDGRIQSFVMAQHDVHTQLGSHPPTPHKADRFMDQVRSLVDGAVQRCISLQTMVEWSIKEWDENFMYHNV